MSKGHRLRLYRDVNGEYRWHRIASNGRLVSNGGEGYKNGADMVTMAFQVNTDLTVDDVINDTQLDVARILYGETSEKKGE